MCAAQRAEPDGRRWRTWPVYSTPSASTPGPTSICCAWPARSVAPDLSSLTCCPAAVPLCAW